MSGYWGGILGILCINIIFAYSIFLPAASGQLNLGGAGFMAIGPLALPQTTKHRHEILCLALNLAALNERL